MPSIESTASISSDQPLSENSLSLYSLINEYQHRFKVITLAIIIIIPKTVILLGLNTANASLGRMLYFQQGDSEVTISKLYMYMYTFK